MTQPGSNFQSSKQRGNATIYVLLVVALFAALSLILARQNSNNESSDLDEGKAELVANQVLAHPLQVKQAVEMMTLTGTDISDLEFMLPGAAGFDSTSTSAGVRVFHPDGGGLVRATLPPEAIDQTTTDPVAGWYLARFTNVEWTKTTTTDVVLVGWQLKKELCEAINLKLVGDPSIPVISNTIPNVFIDESLHGGSNALVFDNTECTDCENIPSLCISDSGGTRFGYYTIIVNR